MPKNKEDVVEEEFTEEDYELLLEEMSAERLIAKEILHYLAGQVNMRFGWVSGIVDVCTVDEKELSYRTTAVCEDISVMLDVLNKVVFFMLEDGEAAVPPKVMEHLLAYKAYAEGVDFDAPEAFEEGEPKENPVILEEEGDEDES